MIFKLTPKRIPSKTAAYAPCVEAQLRTSSCVTVTPGRGFTAAGSRFPGWWRPFTSLNPCTTGHTMSHRMGSVQVAGGFRPPQQTSLNISLLCSTWQLDSRSISPAASHPPTLRKHSQVQGRTTHSPTPLGAQSALVHLVRISLGHWQCHRAPLIHGATLTWCHDPPPIQHTSPPSAVNPVHLGANHVDSKPRLHDLSRRLPLTLVMDYARRAIHPSHTWLSWSRIISEQGLRP